MRAGRCSLRVWLLGATAFFGCLVAVGRAGHEFLKQPLGYPVMYFEPVDIEGDGIWELAVQVGSPIGDQVGVYSPLKRRWADGPHRLPITGNNWGYGDFDRDGYADYAYLVRDSIRISSPWNHVDSVAFSVDFIPNTFQVWGRTGPSQWLMYLYNYRTESDMAPCPDPIEGDYGHVGYLHYVDVYSFPPLEYVRQHENSASRGKVCFTAEEQPCAHLLVYDYDRAYFNGCAPGDEMCFLSYGLSVVDNAGKKDFSVAIAKLSSFGIPSWWGYPAKAYCMCVGRPRTDSVPELYWIVLHHSLSQQAVGGVLTTGKTVPDWSYLVPDDTYAGMAYFDLNEDGQGELLLPRRDRALWEIRDPQTGNLVDSVLSMPSLDLRTAPIMEPDVLDLYYFLDSALYVLSRPGMPTGDVEENEVVSLPSEFILYQNHPNPFNASTIIEFDLDHSGPVTFEIFNILGQGVAVLLDRLVPAGRHRVEWNGCDQQGREVVSGMYFYRLSAGGMASTKKMLLLK